jgi:hypothetical protein
VFVFAFLLASFPARNPDIWAHLAAGRDLAHGRNPTVSPGGATDAHLEPGWLFDLACYGTFAVAGPTGLVAVKAAMVGGLALVLLGLSRNQPGWLIPAFCTGLAVLAIGIRLPLQPVTVSYLFLGLALWSLYPSANGAVRKSGWSGWPLIVLFVVWANTDRWFMLGLGVVGLVELGKALDSPSGHRVRALARAVGLVAVLAAACLVNPAHVTAFGMPPALATSGTGPGGLRGATSPFQRAYLDAVAQSPAGLAYFPLLGLGLVSFALTFRGWRWERFLPWAALAGLSAWQVRTVPFFAVVGGPVLAWNLQDFFARRAATAAPSRRSRVLAGALGTVFGLAFVACAWPGWLQGPPFGPRRWAVETPPGLRQGAEAVCRWQTDGRLGPAAGGLHLTADSVGAFAWFCPQHRAVHDPALSAAVLGEPDAPSDWPDRMRAAGVTHVIVYDTDSRRLGATLERLLADPEQWPLLRLGGGVTVFGWRDPARAAGPDPFAWAEGDLDRQALWPRADERAPPARPAAEPDPRRWWEAFWRPAPSPPDDRDAAAVYLQKAEALRRSALPRHVIAWEATQVAALTAAANGWAAPGALLDARTRLELFQPELSRTRGVAHPLGRVAQVSQMAFQRARGDTPVSVLLLAVRAARRAVAANPRDAQAYALLGEAYLRLAQNTWEQGWAARSFAEVGQLRRAQAAAALTHAVALNANLAEAHFQLRSLYIELGFYDLALKHQRAFVAAVRKAGPSRDASADEFRAALAEAGRETDQIADLVDDRERAFDRESAGVRVLDRAILANDKGLAGKALDILLGSDISAFGAKGMALELELLVRTGRVQEVRDWTAEEHQGALGGLYHWMRAQAFAASGDYALAAEECTRLASALPDSSAPDPSGAGTREVTAALVGQAILDGYRLDGNRTGSVWEVFRRQDFDPRLRQFVAALRREADSLTLRGLLALEEGETEAAAADFRQAMRTWVSPQAVREGWGLDFNGRLAAQQTLTWIDSVPTADGR